MSQNTKFQEYLDTVCQQVKWGKSHAVISKELQNHLQDQKEAYLEYGIEEEQAEEKALLQMGNPVEIGME